MNKFVRSTAIFVPYTQEGKILLQHRTADAPQYPNYWNFWGGSVESGETPEQGVKEKQWKSYN